MQEQMIIKDTKRLCSVCAKVRTHRSVIYTDVEYHTCNNCHTKVTVEYDNNVKSGSNQTRPPQSAPKKLGRPKKGK